MNKTITAYHEDFSVIILTSPLANAIYFVGFYKDEASQFGLIHITMSVQKDSCKVQPFIGQLQIAASPNLSVVPCIRSDVFYQGGIACTEQQLAEIGIALAFLPHTEEHPLKPKRGEILSSLFTALSLDKPFASVTADLLHKDVLYLSMLFCVF